MRVLKMKFLPSVVQKLSSEQTDRQTDGQTDRQTHTQTDRQTQLKLLPTAYTDGKNTLFSQILLLTHLTLPSDYRPQTKLREANVFTPVCQSFYSQRGACVQARHACKGYAWQGDVCGKGAHMAGGHAWQGHAWQGDVCGKGAHMAGGHAWQGHAWQGDVCGKGTCGGGGTCVQERWPLKRAVRILLECILVFIFILCTSDRPVGVTPVLYHCIKSK